MESINCHRPHRAVIRCKAKMQLLETADDYFEQNEAFDDSLLKELATGLFQSEQYRVFFEKCHPKYEVKQVEDEIARELADVYWNVSKRCQDPLVQSLNALL